MKFKKLYSYAKIRISRDINFDEFQSLRMSINLVKLCIDKKLNSFFEDMKK